MKETAIKIKGVFNGLYEWGQGWVSTSKRMAWDDFLENRLKTEVQPIFWKYVPGDKVTGACGSLIGTGDAIYLHPMGFNAILISHGCTTTSYKDGVYYQSAFSSEIMELREICEAVAEACGGTFTLYTSKEFECEVPSADYIITRETDYLKQCANVKKYLY